MPNQNLTSMNTPTTKTTSVRCANGTPANPTTACGGGGGSPVRLFKIKAKIKDQTKFGRFFPRIWSILAKIREKSGQIDKNFVWSFIFALILNNLTGLLEVVTYCCWKSRNGIPIFGGRFCHAWESYIGNTPADTAELLPQKNWV